MENEKIEKLIEENLKLTQEIYKMVKSVKNYLFWQQILGIIKILLVVIPIIIGIIYLPPLLKQAFDQYQKIMGIGQSDIRIDSLLGNSAEIQSLLNSYKINQ